MTEPWRLIEAEIVAWARVEGQEADEAVSGDKVLIFTDDGVPDVNITRLAHHLAQSFVPRTVTVKAS